MTLPTRILLLGSGELGKEFVISAKRLGCYVIACDSYDDAPAQQVADQRETFDMLNEHSINAVVTKHKPDIIVPEIEAIRTEALFNFEAQGIQVVPSAQAVNYTMNRDRIRDLVANELGIRTPRFGYAESASECLSIAESIGYPIVMKPVMSSSGKGQSVAHTPADISPAWEYACSGMRGDRERVIIEEFINFEYEITLLTVQQKTGETLFCEPIAHRQERGDYQESWQPVMMNSELAAQAKKISKTVTEALGGAGVFGVEMFITKNEVIFSELSPRPHDTGMVTLSSQNLSEFDLHARAILGLPIPEISIHGPSASHVVLADRDAKDIAYNGIEETLRIPGVEVRIFGKPTARPNRRMAVCLAVGTSIEDARFKVQEASKKIQLLYLEK
ncbi:formate-dependent phosphoribosylglycinamide formyltransferase [Dehalococcoidia bacterium]|nr:formate-dependent phosphoribosylglycinamide formyltransferase [Dehalococcoidia bacterium]